MRAEGNDGNEYSSNNYSGAGGGGAGGSIQIHTPSLAGIGCISVQGGDGGDGWLDYSGRDGGGGSITSKYFL